MACVQGPCMYGSLQRVCAIAKPALPTALRCGDVTRQFTTRVCVGTLADVAEEKGGKPRGDGL